MRVTLTFALTVLSVGFGVNAYSEREAVSAIQGLFARQSPGMGQTTPSSPFDPKSPNAPPECANSCDTAFNTSNSCKEAKCLCTAEHADALGKCLNCVLGKGLGSPVEAAFAVSIFEEVCRGNGVSNLPTPTISLPPNFTLPPGVSTGSNGQFTIGTTVTASVSEIFGAPATTTIVVPPPGPTTSSGSSTTTAPPSGTTHASSSTTSAHATSSTSSHSNAAAFAAPTALTDLVPMAVVGAFIALV